MELRVAPLMAASCHSVAEDKPRHRFIMWVEVCHINLLTRSGSYFLVYQTRQRDGRRRRSPRWRHAHPWSHASSVEGGHGVVFFFTSSYMLSLALIGQHSHDGSAQPRGIITAGRASPPTPRLTAHLGQSWARFRDGKIQLGPCTFSYSQQIRSLNPDIVVIYNNYYTVTLF